MHVVVYALVYVIKEKKFNQNQRPFSQTNMFEEKKSWPLSDGVYSYCLLLRADFMRRGALIMMLRHVSGEAPMCPQNVAYTARSTNCKSATLRAFKKQDWRRSGADSFKTLQSCRFLLICLKKIDEWEQSWEVVSLDLDKVCCIPPEIPLLLTVVS